MELPPTPSLSSSTPHTPDSTPDSRAPKRSRSPSVASTVLDGSMSTKRSRSASVSTAVDSVHDPEDPVPERFPWFRAALRSGRTYEGPAFSNEDLVKCRDWYNDMVEGRAPAALQKWDTAHKELDALFDELSELERREKKHLRQIKRLTALCNALEAQLAALQKSP